MTDHTTNHHAAELEPLLTTDDVAKRLRISLRQVRRLIASGELEVIRIGRCIRVPPAALDALIERSIRRVSTAPPVRDWED